MEADVGVAIDNVEGKIPIPSSSRGGEACDQPHEQGHTTPEHCQLTIKSKLHSTLPPSTFLGPGCLSQYATNTSFDCRKFFDDRRRDNTMELEGRWNSWLRKTSRPSARAIGQADRAGKLNRSSRSLSFREITSLPIPTWLRNVRASPKITIRSRSQDISTSTNPEAPQAHPSNERVPVHKLRRAGPRAILQPKIPSVLFLVTESPRPQPTIEPSIEL